MHKLRDANPAQLQAPVPSFEATQQHAKHVAASLIAAAVHVPVKLLLDLGNQNGMQALWACLVPDYTMTQPCNSKSAALARAHTRLHNQERRQKLMCRLAGHVTAYLQRSMSNSAAAISKLKVRCELWDLSSGTTTHKAPAQV